MGDHRDRGRRVDEGYRGTRIDHPSCFSDAIPSRVTCGPATCPRVEEHLGNPCRQAQVRDEEFIIDADKLCPAGRTYRKDLTAASSPGSGKLCPGFTASQGLAGPRRQADRPSCGPAKKKSSSARKGWGLSRDLRRFRNTQGHRQIRRCGRIRPGRTVGQRPSNGRRGIWSRKG